ncbi:hypothetical protein OSB04_019966 [Centaurea solstitialis]|uniref:Reverse transcriptase zinc-binding domain-containing protein n=1 Tax=Centaurea solstitialis TaxID=347529 RepID=A0AA38SRU1_9ASTR|nr:hypothetical protein OSB04_019966 [Centaurea solstitialis]
MMVAEELAGKDIGCQRTCRRRWWSPENSPEKMVIAGELAKEDGGSVGGGGCGGGGGRRRESPEKGVAGEGCRRKVYLLHLSITRFVEITLILPGSGSWNQTRNSLVGSLRNFIDAVALPLGDSETNWIPWIPSKANILVWRVLINRMETMDNLQKRGVTTTTDSCSMCHSSPENLDNIMSSPCDTGDWWPASETSAVGIWSKIRAIKGGSINKEVCKVIGAAIFWIVWAQRNSMVFKGVIKKRRKSLEISNF